MKLTKGGTPDKRAASLAARNEAMGPEARAERARAAAAARWGQYQIEVRSANQWTTDGIGTNPLRSIAECRQDIAALRALAAEDDEWVGEYAIVSAEKRVIEYHRI